MTRTKIIWMAFLAAGLLTMGAQAKCFTFSKTGGDVGVCVPGDSTDSRKQAKKT